MNQATYKEEFVKLHKYMRIYLWTILRINFFRRGFTQINTAKYICHRAAVLDFKYF